MNERLVERTLRAFSDDLRRIGVARARGGITQRVYWQHLLGWTAIRT